MDDPASVPVILPPGQGRRIDLGNFAMSLKASGADTGGAFALLEAAEPADFGPPLHVHDDCSEAFYVLEGSYVVFVAGREYSCPAGSFVFVPAGIEHGFRVGPNASRKLNFYVPAAMVGYFDALSAAITAGDADPDMLDAIASRHHMRVIGPVPDGYL